MATEETLNGMLKKHSGAQLFFLTCMRVIIGWHFLYEGYVKVTGEGWSSAGYLNAAPGPFAGIFSAIGHSAWMVGGINIIMSWGLTLIGLALILGLFTRSALVGAALFLFLFYITNPPWFGVQFMAGEGSYMIVNKNLVEFSAALVLLAFPSGQVWGFDRLFVKQ